MNEVQIYIGNVKLDLFEDENISLTSSIQNSKDIGKIFTDFTQSFSVPASATNKKYLNITISRTLRAVMISMRELKPML